MTENEIIENLDDIWTFGHEPTDEERLAANKAIDLIQELQQYRAIGTVEECREATEKMRGKKPILDTIYHQQYYCPNCEDFLVRKNGNKPHHCICGQAIDWSDAP